MWNLLGFARRPVKRNIMLDFDGTCTKGHSGGTYEVDPMDRANKTEFESNVKKWLYDGHNVAIITRGIDKRVEKYFREQLGIQPVMNGFEEGKLSIYAPDEAMFRQYLQAHHWSYKKPLWALDFIQKTSAVQNSIPSIFIDDTYENVTAMKEKSKEIPELRGVVSFHVQEGDYMWTFNKVNNEFLQGKLGGGRLRGGKTSSKKKNKRRRKTKSKRI